MFLDFRKAFDLIDQNKLLENMFNIAVRLALINWLAVFLKDRSHHTRVGEKSRVFGKSMEVCNKEVELGSGLIVHINKLPKAIEEALYLRLPCEWQNECCIIIDDDTILFMDDSTTCKII